MMPGKKISCLLVFIVFMMISFAARYIGSYITHFVHPLILVGAIFLAVGLLFLNSYRRRIKRARASRFWPTVEGQIVVSDIAVLDDTDDSDDYYRPNIVYRYIVQDRGYEGKSVAFGMENTKHRNRERAEKVQLHYPVGGNVMVHYDPADPSVSTLEPGNTEWTGSAAPFMFALLFAFVVIGIGIYEQLNLSGTEWSWVIKLIPYIVFGMVLAGIGFRLYRRNR